MLWTSKNVKPFVENLKKKLYSSPPQLNSVYQKPDGELFLKENARP